MYQRPVESASRAGAFSKSIYFDILIFLSYYSVPVPKQCLGQDDIVVDGDPGEKRGPGKGCNVASEAIERGDRSEGTYR